MPNILIIDDERAIRRTLREILEYEKYKVDDAEDGSDGLAKIRAKDFDIVLCDITMPKMNGLEVLDAVLEEKPDLPIVMISGNDQIETAVEAIKKGAFDYIPKPLDLNRLLVTVRNAMNSTSQTEEIKVLKRKVSKAKSDVAIIGESDALGNIKEMIEKVAGTDARVLVTGENGTGKELVARSLHKQSNRHKMPFVEVNCAAIPSELIESELFGHEKGAFTSAIKQRNGKFEQADGGTLFLDEIGDMSMSAQAKVLRALQENKITRVGGDKDITVNVRVVAATNKDLRHEIENNNFREDLYHRLGVILIHVPALRDRAGDIPLLANHFIKIICQDHGMPEKWFNDDALAALKEYRWTGNIRELRNVVERLVILCGKEITGADVRTYVPAGN